MGKINYRKGDTVRANEGCSIGGYKKGDEFEVLEDGFTAVFRDKDGDMRHGAPWKFEIVRSSPEQEALAILRELDNSRQLNPSMAARVRALLAYADGK